MFNEELIAEFATWLRSTDRAESTIKLRLAHIRDLARDLELLRATTSALETHLARYRDNAPETRKARLSSLRLFYKWARQHALRADDPTESIESIRIPQRVPRVCPDNAVRHTLRHANDQERAMILLARFGCLRLSELASLHMNDRSGDMLVFIGKGNKQRAIALNDDLLSALRRLERVQPHGYYFPGRFGVGHLHPQSVNKIIKRLLGWNPHSLRHAGATAAYNGTKDLRAVQDMLGHATLATTQRYLHLDMDARRRVANATAMRLSA